MQTRVREIKIPKSFIALSLLTIYVYPTLKKLFILINNILFRNKFHLVLQVDVLLIVNRACIKIN